MKILYISVVSNQVSGGTYVMNRNLELIRSVSGSQVQVVQVAMQSKLNALISAIVGGNFILSRKDEKMILQIVKDEHFDYVFLEGTSSGHLSKQLSKLRVKFIVFAHNVETILYEERMKRYRFNLIDAVKLWTIKRNEKRSVSNCSKLVTLTERDAVIFYNKFGRIADAIIPISYDSKDYNLGSEYDGEEYCLFVGSNFFPNIEGMEWFMINVVPFINIRLKVVGTCCNGLPPLQGSLLDKVEYLGLIDDLKPLYQHASIVVAPIFKGSGMKTKTIEAMSYGKTIVGTEECFQGIECNYSKIGGLCNTAEEFIDVINNYDGGKYNEYTAKLFESKYSNKVIQDKFNGLFKS